MGKILVLAEKPSVARDIAKVLNCKKRGDGYLEGDKYIVSWAVGHLVTLYEPEEYDAKYKKWRVDTLPIIPDQMKIKPIDGTKKQFEIIKRLMQSKNVDSLICATDAGREGELIFRYTYEAAGCSKPFQRLWISSMTDEAIKDGFASLKPGEEYNNLYSSARCRSEADWLVGMNASRAYTLKYNTLLSIGRVQTPTLAILVQRQKEIDDFTPQDYWEVNAIFDSFKGTWFDKETKESKIMKKEKAEELAAMVKGKLGNVLSIENDKKKQVPPLLYDLTELQRDANKKFGFSAQKTLNTIQDLYEKRKAVTYPRTDSRYLSHDMLGKIKSTLNKINVEPYKEHVKYVLDLPKLPTSKRIIDDSKVTDHHAIIPTDVIPNIKAFTQDEFRIYDLIVKRFICVFYPNYEYTITRITTEVQGEHFLTKGKTILKLGWMELYKTDNKDKAKESKKSDESEDSEDASNQELPKLKKGEQVTAVDSELVQKKTKPPSAYTEASLLSAMENAGRFVEDEELKEQLKEGGLGTPATRASIIERLIQVGYIARKGKTIYPTEKGMKLIDVLPMELRSPETTGKWERGLSSISKGKLGSERFMESIKRYVKYIIQESSRAKRSVIFKDENRDKTPKIKLESLGKCPCCKDGEVLENSKAFYCSNWRSGCKFTIWKNQYERLGISLQKDMIIELIKNNKLENLEITKPGSGEKGKAVIELKGANGATAINVI
ncbi:MAG: DNA topoisomerase 3 [Bacillota bacterium]|nr:DNA topoisomerase 3 [Bacillota bacterium]